MNEHTIVKNWKTFVTNSMKFRKNNKIFVQQKNPKKKKPKFLCMVQVSGQKYIGLFSFFFYIFMDDHHFNYEHKIGKRKKRIMSSNNVK